MGILDTAKAEAMLGFAKYLDAARPKALPSDQVALAWAAMEARSWAAAYDPKADDPDPPPPAAR